MFYNFIFLAGRGNIRHRKCSPLQEVFIFSRFIYFFFIACTWLLALTETAEGRQKTIFSMDVVAS
ncbi:hypothetical protein DDG50_23070, partial [Escherichia coli]|nr:hypothetical protein [Escherichia coli]